MKRKWISTFLCITIVVSLCLLSAPEPAVAANPGDVLIVEIGADPASSAGHAEPASEFLEVYNNTGSTINLNGWTLDDNGTITITLPDINLGAGKILVIIADDSTFTIYGCGGANSPLHYEPTSWFNNNIANSNDHIILKDNLNNTIDAVSYGSDTTAFNPPASNVFNNSGRTLQRGTYNASFTDTDSANDWSGSTGAGTPCDVTPTALTLTTITATSPRNNWLPAALLVSAVIVLGGAFVLRRRRRQT